MDEFLVQRANEALNNLEIPSQGTKTALFDYTETSPKEHEKIKDIIEEGGTQKQATLYLIAGAIGSGKTTFAHRLMQDQHFSDYEFVSADIYAENLFNKTEDIKKNHRMAKEYMGFKIFSLISSQAPFVWEMVPSKLEKLFPLRAAIHRNYKLTLFYVSTGDVQVNVDRVAQRSTSSAWSVSEDKVRSRYQMCLQNLPALTGLCDTVIEVSTNRFPGVASLESADLIASS